MKFPPSIFAGVVLILFAVFIVGFLIPWLRDALF